MWKIFLGVAVVLVIIYVYIITRKKETLIIGSSCRPVNKNADFGDLMKSRKVRKSYLKSMSNNQFPHIPGSAYQLHEYPTNDNIPGKMTVKLIYSDDCKKHPLVPLFYYIMKDMTNDKLQSTAKIVFITEIVDKTIADNVSTDLSSLPRIIRTQPDGHTVEYHGNADYGELQDWILNQNLWY